MKGRNEMTFDETEARLRAEKQLAELYRRLDEIYQTAPEPFDPSAPYPPERKDEFLRLEREYDTLMTRFGSSLWPSRRTRTRVLPLS